MTADKLVGLARAAQKVAPGPWEAEGEETESGWGEHDEFVLLDAQGRRMCGTENADAEFGSISEENDGDGGHWQWNEHSRVLMHFIAACDPATILGLVDHASALEASEAKNAALGAENATLREKVRKLQKPEFFWDYNNPECCYDSWSDALDEPNLGDVVHLLTGISLPEVWVTTRVLTVDEDGDPDETEPALFHNEAEASACFPTSLESARAALRQEADLG